VTAEGFKFREKLFASFNELITWFKQHFMDPIPVARPATLQPSQPIRDTQISSQMSDMSIDHGRNNHNNSHRTPAYPASSRTPAHTAFDSIVNNSQASQGSTYAAEPAGYSTTDHNDSYSAPGGQRYGEANGQASGGGYGRGNRGRGGGGGRGE
jgi:hypothetical protein